MIININVANKRPTVDGTPIIVCGNSDYQIQFTFDEEWDNSLMKHARFAWRKGGDARYIDVPFLGDTVDVPMLTEVRFVYVGVYTDHLQTTTPARIACEYSIRCNSGEDIQEPTPEDVLVDLFNLVTSQQDTAIQAAQEASAAIELVRVSAAEAVQANAAAQEAAITAVRATSTKQNKLAWVTDEDIDAMFAGTYEGVETEDPEEGEGDGTGAIDLSEIPEVDSLDNPTEESPTAVRCDGEIYILVKED